MARWKPDPDKRLMAAAIELFAERGYEATTVAEIAERAGLTKRTFFRYFADKREVLFDATAELERRWVEAIAATPDAAGPLEAACAGFPAMADLFADRHAFAGQRSRIIEATPELHERELIKLQHLAGAIKAALLARGVAEQPAVLASQAAVTVFHVAFNRWVAQDDPAAFAQLLEASLEELRAVTAAGVPAATA